MTTVPRLLEKVYDKIMAKGRKLVVEGYGMTESSPVIAVNTYEPGQRKIGTCRSTS